MDSQKQGGRKAKAVGINHIALEVGNIDEALDFYSRIFDFELRGRGEGMAFIDLGDQFIALTLASAAPGPARDGTEQRHFGLVVDDRSTVRDRAAAAGARLIEGTFLDFLDPWGNRLQIVDYADIQFTKVPAVLRAMGLELAKSEKAVRELRAKGMVELQ